MFHKKCLLASMLRKCQCPVCRTQLSPMEQLKPLIGDVSMLRVHQLRGAVVEAASRGRNAVR